MATLTSYLMYKGSGFPNGDDGTAISLADDFAGIDAPKSKFMFTMTIEPADSRFLPGYITDPALVPESNDITIPLKTATRPEPTIEYMDVNYYNYRTKVPVKVDVGSLTITMYDDRNNASHSLAMDMLTAYYGIADSTRNAQPKTDGSALQEAVGLDAIIPNPILTADYDDKFGVSFKSQTDMPATGPFKHIDIHHYHYSGDQVNVVTYRYVNPKMTTMSMDSLDMSDSDAPIISVTFNYDYFMVFGDRGRSGVVSVGDIIPL